MAQKEDILEQIVEEYLIHEGFFVQRNVKYKPDPSRPDYNPKSDSVHSDIDVLGIHPRRSAAEAVFAINIKSWQGGFDFKKAIDEIEQNKVIARRESRLRYRELAIPKWSSAFIAAVESRTGRREFTHVLAVTLPKGDPKVWENHEAFRVAMSGNPLRVLTLKEMVERIEPGLTKTPAATDIGRTLQLFRAAGLRPKPARPEQSEEVESDA
jgi:hypothetical protein